MDADPESPGTATTSEGYRVEGEPGEESGTIVVSYVDPECDGDGDGRERDAERDCRGRGRQRDADRPGDQQRSCSPISTDPSSHATAANSMSIWPSWSFWPGASVSRPWRVTSPDSRLERRRYVRSWPGAAVPSFSRKPPVDRWRFGEGQLCGTYPQRQPPANGLNR